MQSSVWITYDIAESNPSNKTTSVYVRKLRQTSINEWTNKVQPCNFHTKKIKLQLTSLHVAAKKTEILITQCCLRITEALFPESP